MGAHRLLQLRAPEHYQRTSALPRGRCGRGGVTRHGRRPPNLHRTPGVHAPFAVAWPWRRATVFAGLKAPAEGRLRSVHDSSQHPCPSPRTGRARRCGHPSRGPRIDRDSDDSTRLHDPSGRVGGPGRYGRRRRRRRLGGALSPRPQEEGQVNLIALPDNWANYGGILQSFRDKYPGVDNPVQNPGRVICRRAHRRRDAARLGHDARLARRRPAVRACRPTEEGIWDPYMPTVWDEIPENLQRPGRQLGGRVLRDHGDRREHDDRPSGADLVRRAQRPAVRRHGRPQR